MNTEKHVPLILAPAGNKASFLAAVAAGADAIYCGLKNFSARMEADNFSTEELSSLTQLAHSKGVQVYIALNSLIKPGDVQNAAHLVDKLKRFVKPDALIVSDLAFVKIIKETGFKGEVHLSTLANMSFPGGMQPVRESFGVNRVVIPRELNIDEIKLMAENCPPGVDLEIFIHGALCYGVSGRCYWSSFLGGKSGLRGRCVQPCRRIYDQNKTGKRFFSSQDLSLDVLVKVLLTIPQITTWKIEGRKKGPHYVYYTVMAYKMLRDQGSDPQAKKTALGLLEQALGRPSTHYGFLPQRPQNPVDTNKMTGSGMFVGSLKGAYKKQYLIPRTQLLAGDLLRIGYEDAMGHTIQKVYKSVPKKGRLHMKFTDKKAPAMGSPVFLIDRREKELQTMINELETELASIPPAKVTPSTVSIRTSTNRSKKKDRTHSVIETTVRRSPAKRAVRGDSLWLSEKAISAVPKKMISDCWWWLPPVIWPENEKSLRTTINRILKTGARKFVLNAPFQVAFFNKPQMLDLWAGPFCNQSNGASASVLASAGFSGIIASPELNRDDFMELPKQSPLPVGVVLSGSWPLVISRVVAENFKTDTAFTSPKGEQAWVKKYGPDYWIFPNWKTDITSRKNDLLKAGYSFFIHMEEHIPKNIKLRNRPGKWNWDLKLL